MASMLNKESNDLALKNKKLVFHIIKGIRRLPSQKRDIEQEGMIGLLNAARTFDSSYKVSFSTYASRCISNEIYMYFRREKKHRCNISWNYPIGIDGEGNEFTLMDVISDPDSDFDVKIAQFDLLKRGLLLVLNVLEERQRLVILYRMANLSQGEIAEKLKLSRSYVSRIELKAHMRIKKFMDNKLEYEEVFSLPAVGKIFPIVFSSKKVPDFNQIFSRLLLKLPSQENLPDFKLSCNKERIIIFLPDHPDSFSFLAEIVKQVDEYSMKYEPGSQDLVDTDSIQNDKEQETEVEDNSLKEESEPERVVPENTVGVEEKPEVIMEAEGEHEVNLSDNSVDERNNSEEVVATPEKEESVCDKITDGLPSFMAKHSAVVRKYLLTLDTFTTKEIKEHFPNYMSDTINNAIYLAKQKKLIIQIRRGQYKVAK